MAKILKGNSQNIEKCIVYIQLHLNRRISVNQLAEIADLSPSYFFTLFKQKTGYSPITFINRLRMCHACRLLRETDWSVREVAAMLGYNDQFYFSRLFKLVNGVAPTDFRLARSNVAPLISEAPEALAAVTH
jgi:AraC-like DNA-binding protein